MSRTRYLDYRIEDSTELWNTMFRGMLEAGVYLGFNVSQGSSGTWWLKFTHDTDPDNTGEVLGVIRTPDGVVVQENANQDNVAYGAAPSADEIHWLVASYTYNKALPNNDVVYYVKVATAPATPTLTDDEIVIAEIDVPVGSTSYSDSGVYIKNVAKKRLYGISDYSLFQNFDSILDPGIYDGMELTEGSTALDVNLEAGVWISQQNAKIVEASQQADLFTLTNPGNNFYSLSWVIGMHKNEDTDPSPSVDYLLVQGTPAAIGAQATLPSNSTILSAAAAVNSKYDSAVYINKLGYIRTENQNGTYVITYVRGETLLEQYTIIVYGANQRSPFKRSGKYYGHQGLVEAISDIYAISSVRGDSAELGTDIPSGKPYTIWLDGDFQLEDTYLSIPSHIKLQGIGAPCVIESDESTYGVLRAIGFLAEWDTSNATVSSSTWATGSPPSGYVARTWTIQPVYRVGEDLVARMFSKGDKIVVSSQVSPFNSFDCYFQEYDTSSNNWTINVYVEDQYNTDGNPTELNLEIQKSNIHLMNMDVRRKTSAGDGLLLLGYLTDVHLENVKCREFSMFGVENSHYLSLEVENDIVQWEGSYNRYDHLKLTCPQAILTLGNSNDTHCHYGNIEVEAGSVTQDFTFVAGSHCKTEKLSLNGGAGSSLTIDMEESVIDRARVDASSGDINISGSTSSALIGQCSCPGDFTFLSGAANNIVVQLLEAANLVDNSGVAGNKVLSFADTNYQGFLEHANSDRNLKLVSDGNISWDAATGVLTWDAALYFDNPWTTGYSEVAAGNATLGTDGDRLVIDIDRSATGAAAVSTAVVTKAGTATNAYQQDRVFVAIRYGDVIYLFDGTRIEDSQTVQVGTTPPPDGSVTYDKLAPSAVAFHNQFFRDYVSLDSSVDWENAVIVRNTDLRTMTYTTATGVIQYSGAIDLSSVRVGDMVVLAHSHESVTDCWTREEIYEVDDLNNRITISTGLGSLVTGSASIWNGAIVRGDMVADNYSLSTLSYDKTNGRITFTPGINFKAYQVSVGYVFVDTNGKKYLIQDRDISGNGDWVDIGIGRRDVGTGVPTETWQGSIRVNNNPHNIKTADLRVSSGMEFIPIDWFGQREDVDGEDLSIFDGSEYGKQIVFPEPRDERVRVCLQMQGRSSDRQSPGYSSGTPDKTSIQAMEQNFDFVDVTAVCTGAALVVEHIGLVSSALPVYVDGEALTYYSRFSGSEQCNNTYSPLRHFHGNLVTQFFLTRIPLGVHNIRWVIPKTLSAGYVNPVAVRGIILFTTPGADDNVVVHSPGTLIRAGEVVEFSDPVIAELPSSTESWNKGGRVVRYIDSTNSYAWSNEWVRGFTDTGTTASGPDIVSVANPTQWRVGDLMLLINGTTRYIHVVTVISGTTITVSPNVAFTQAGATLYYYGHVPYDSANDYYDRPAEEVAAQFMLSEFACGGPANDHRGPAVFIFTDTRTVPIGVRLSDLSTLLEADSGWANQNADGTLANIEPRDWLEWPDNGTLRIRFIGTGLALTVIGTTNLGIRIDGMSTDAAVLQSSATRKNDRTGGTYIVGELPYGYHKVDIVDTSGSADQRVQKITIFKPKKPTIPAGGFELFDSNIRSATDNELSLDLVDGVGEVQFGNQNYDAGAIVRLEKTESLSDVARTFGNAIGHKDWKWSSGGAPSGALYDFVFTGKEFTIVWDTLSLGGGNPLSIYVKDYDGQFRAPSALTGFSVTGVDTVSSIGGIANRERWIFSVGGTHTVRIAAGNVGDNVSMNSVEWAPRLHNYQTKKPYGFEHYMPFQHQGLDLRNMTPLPAHLLPLPSFGHVQTLFIEDTVNVTAQNPFFFYCHGGLMEITVNAVITHNQAGSISWRVEIDGAATDQFDGFRAFQDAAGLGTSALTFSSFIVLPPGLHWAILRLKGASTLDDIDRVRWAAKFLSNGSPNSLLNRGLLPSFGNNGMKTERQY